MGLRKRYIPEQIIGLQHDPTPQFVGLSTARATNHLAAFCGATLR